MKFTLGFLLFSLCLSTWAGNFTINIATTGERVQNLVVRRIEHMYNDFAELGVPNPTPANVTPIPMFTLQITTRVENTAVERKIYWSFSTYGDSVAFKNSLNGLSNVNCTVYPLGPEFTYRVMNCNLL